MEFLNKHQVVTELPQFSTRFIINLRITNSILDFKAISLRIATLIIKTGTEVYPIINGHAPINENKKKIKEIEEFWQQHEVTMIKVLKTH